MTATCEEIDCKLSGAFKPQGIKPQRSICDEKHRKQELKVPRKPRASLQRRRWIVMITFVGVALLGWRVCSRLALRAVIADSFGGTNQLDVDERWEDEHPQIIGHRGSGLSSTEKKDEWIGNTFNAISAGIQAGADWIEIDVRATLDNDGLIVFHDPVLEGRTTGEGSVANLSLKQIRNARTHTEPNETIPTLDEVFGRFDRPEQKWVLDIKVTGIQRQLLSSLDRNFSGDRHPKERLILFGGYHELLEYKDSGYSLGYTLLAGKLWNQYAALFDQPQIIQRLRDLECQRLVLPVVFASESLIAEANRNGYEVWVYGVRTVEVARRLQTQGATGFIVDEPQKFVCNHR